MQFHVLFNGKKERKREPVIRARASARPNLLFFSGLSDGHASSEMLITFSMAVENIINSVERGEQIRWITTKKEKKKGD